MPLPRKGGRGEEGGSKEEEERGRGRREWRVVSREDNFGFAQRRLQKGLLSLQLALHLWKLVSGTNSVVWGWKNTVQLHEHAQGRGKMD